MGVDRVAKVGDADLGPRGALHGAARVRPVLSGGSRADEPLGAGRVHPDLAGAVARNLKFVFLRGASLHKATLETKKQARLGIETKDGTHIANKVIIVRFT